MKEVALLLTPRDAADEKVIREKASRISGIPVEAIRHIRFRRRSVDARKRKVMINLLVEVWSEELPPDPLDKIFIGKDVSKAREVIIVGSGPAGLFAALTLIENGLRPVILERGKEVSHRKVDVARISREHLVDADSNYCFGEGGAGTFSDGKLYTRSKKKGDNMRVMKLLVMHGAHPSILYEAHPHIGTDKLPAVITSIRETITSHGGVYLFDKRVVDLILEKGSVAGVRCNDGSTYRSDRVILATGHSARDIYAMLDSKGIDLEVKPFAAGVRVEHPQALIDRIQYHGAERGNWLPAASYSLATQVSGRGVYSFCMCPGGFIVPSATSPSEVVVNGMSPSRRNSPYANSGIVVEIKPEDIPRTQGSHPALSGIEFQQELEKAAWLAAGKTQSAPAQRLSDFVAGIPSGSLPAVSYFPGVVASPLHEWLPGFLSKRLREAFLSFNGKMKGYITHEAVVTGVESRSSSPVRIPRNDETLQHIRIVGLYPAGEGSGYSGGIVSSAVDGIRVAESISAT